MINYCQYLYTVVSSDCSRLAGCRVGLSKHHPDMSLFRFCFSLDQTCQSWQHPALPMPLPPLGLSPCRTPGSSWWHYVNLGRSTFDSQVLGRMIWLPDLHSAPWDEPHRVSSSWAKGKWFDLEEINGNQPDGNQLEAFLLKPLHNLTNKSPLKQSKFTGVINWGIVHLDSIRLDHDESSLSLSPCLSL